MRLINKLLRSSLAICSLFGTISTAAAGPDPDELRHLADAAGGLEVARREIRSQLDARMNSALGSWREDGMVAGDAVRLEYLRWRAHGASEPQLAEIIARSQVTYLELLDPVWGGAYAAIRAAAGPNGPLVRGIDPHKRLAAQADALTLLSGALAQTGEVRFRNALAKVDAYLQDWLAASSGMFFAGQDTRPPRLPDHVSIERYWSLRTAHERRRFGIPEVERRLPGAANAQVVSAYARAFAASGEENFLRVAERAALSLLDERRTDGGWLREDAVSGQPGPGLTPRLALQVRMGHALLDLYAVSGERRWLQTARQLAAAMLATLHDGHSGGFFARAESPEASSPGSKPLEANALAARFFYALSVYTGDATHAQLVRPTLEAVTSLSTLHEHGLDVAETGIALELLGAGYVELVVVGDGNAAAARALFAAARRAYQPRKLLHFEAPGRFPAREGPALYICSPDRCSAPVEDPAAVVVELEQFRGAAQTPYP